MDGKLYKAVKRKLGICSGCVAEYNFGLCCRLGNCGKPVRQDNTDVIWKLHIKVGEVIDE